MKVVQINFTCLWGSTGKICNSVSSLLSQNGIENYIFYIYGKNPEKKKHYIRYGNFIYTKTQALKAKIFGSYGFNSSLATKILMKKLDVISPDIVHIHNIHGHDCNFEMLFNYLKKKKIKVYYTFHDCWAFTGYCPHFTMEKCENWLSNCQNCPLKSRFSWFIDQSKRNFNRKMNALKDLDMTIITPSEWLARITKQSFLKNYPIKVIHNGIDLQVFMPMKSNFKNRFGLQNKKIVLGVAFGWGKSKGLDVFIRLANELPKEYQVVLVGTNEKIDKILPSNILSIHRTHNQKELAEIYSAADVFVNPTREEVLGLTNIEANACGVPVITYNAGGSPECINENSGVVVEIDDYDRLLKEIITICENKPFNTELCRKQAEKFDMNDKFMEYVDLYKNTLTKLSSE